MAVTEISARANAAVDDLYRRHVGDVYRYSYAVLGNHADAEDVTQTTFVNALRALERGETPRDASRWLLVIAHNVVRQRWRQAAARPTLVELDGDVADGTLDVEEDVELEELVRALQRIPETQREALVMRELEGRSYREIAEVLAISSSALETLLFRARRSLAEELENVVTCQNAEQVMSKQLDGRVSRKERKRLEAHLQECPSCSRLAAAQKRQRRAFKGLALLPLPLGLALFKGAPTASAATALPTIGLGTNGAAGTGAGAAAASGTGGTAVGGSFLGAAAAKIAVAVVAATVATGVGYKGVQALRDEPAPAPVVVVAAPDAGPRIGVVQPKPPVAFDPVVAKNAVAGATAGAASGAKSVARVKSAVTATGSAATYAAPAPTSGTDGTSGAKPESAAAPVVPKPTETPSAPKPEKPKQAAPPPKAAPAPVQRVAPPAPPATPPAAPPVTPPAAPVAAVPAPPATPPAATQPPPVTSPAPPVTPPAPPVTPPVPTPTDTAPTDPAPPPGEDSGSDGQPGNGNGWGHHKGKHDGKHPWDG